MSRRFYFIPLLVSVFVTGTVAQDNKKPFRIGVAGLTHGHVGWILDRADDGDIEIAGIAEADKALAEKYLKRYNLPMSLWYATLSEMLIKRQPEAVAGFGSTVEHLDVVKACAPRGIHVMVEKPLAVSLDHANQIRALAQRYRIHVITNYETTWYGSNLTVEELLRTNPQLGKIRKMVIHDGHEGPKEIGVGKEFLDWLTDPVRNGGGALMDFGCYGANLMTWLMDGRRPMQVLAVTQQMKPDIYPLVEDEATIILTYPEAQGIIQASWNWPFGRKDMEVYGEKGYVIADRQGAKVRTMARDYERWVPGATLERPYNDPFSYMAALVRSEISISPTDLSSLENNLIVVEILEAAKQSARLGRAVMLHEEVKK